jgi:transposase
MAAIRTRGDHGVQGAEELAGVSQMAGSVMHMRAIALAKPSFHVHGVDAEGRVISRRVGRAKLLGLVERLGPAVVAMEACATAHHWARAFMAAGREVRLVTPRFVTLFVRGSKNDATDAETIFDAAGGASTASVHPKASTASH